jgi:hypothetical protein
VELRHESVKINASRIEGLLSQPSPTSANSASHSTSALLLSIGRRSPCADAVFFVFAPEDSKMKADVQISDWTNPGAHMNESLAMPLKTANHVTCL